MISTLAPEEPPPEATAETDHHFAAARAVTTARQVRRLTVPLLISVTLAAVAWRLSRGKEKGPGCAVVKDILFGAASLGTIVTLWLVLTAIAVVVVARAAGATVPLAREVVWAVAVGAAAFGGAFAVGHIRRIWPTVWWMIPTGAVALVGTAVPVLISPLGARPVTGRDGFLAERARLLFEEQEFPAYRVLIARAAARRGELGFRVFPGRREVVVTPAAAGLDRYEAEVFLALAFGRGESLRRTPAFAAALIAFMASLLVADACAAVITKRQKVREEAVNLYHFGAVFIAFWFIISPAFNAYSRAAILRTDAQVISATRKPLVAVDVFYKMGAANLISDRPNAVLHFLLDACPSPYERARGVRKLRWELVKDKAARPPAGITF